MTRDEILKRTWAEISLDAIRYNFENVKKAAAGAKVMAIVKADAYGHGDRMTAPFLEECGADWFGVSNLQEALGIRESGVSKPILILGTTPAECVMDLKTFGITQALYSLEYAKELSKAATDAGITIDVHLKFDTGMGRIGFVASDECFEQSLEESFEAANLPGIHVSGAFTHFASADELDDSGRNYTLMQFNRFCRICGALKEKGVEIGLRHCCNSAATVLNPEMHMDMVRAGIILYGLYPCDDRELKEKIKLKPAMQLKTVISLVKEYKKGGCVSYGRKFTAPKDMLVASTAIGYADGYHRVLSGKAPMIVCGQRVNTIGRICMDQTMLDVTNVPNVKEGDIVTVFGQDGDAAVTVDELASLADTINYEIVCALSRRVPRRFYLRGENIHNFDYARWMER